ncbi:MAG: hypothetical protein RLZZ436_2633 [Planctomycetota bacterium]
MSSPVHSRIRDSITECVGSTPLVRLSRLADGLPVELIAKVENLNPLWSVKDRIALAMIESAEHSGELRPGMTVLEATSGNTGIGLAFICAARGYRLRVVMPETATIERRRLVAAFGAEVILTPAIEGMTGAISRAESMLAESGGTCFMPRQFRNPANPEVHRRTTAEEIWRDTGGVIDVFVAGVGTGGTITGVAEVLRQRRPGVRVVAVEPAASPVISQTLAGQPLRPGRHSIQGIGAGFVPGNLNLEIIDEVIVVADDDAVATTRCLAKQEGLFCGISCGAAAWAALQIAARPENVGKRIVVMLPDLGERYLSTTLFPA